MSGFTVVSIAFGLAMDAFAVSVTSGFTIKKLHIRHALRIAAFFGAFQALMPLVGWLAGLGFRDLISGIDHWVAFGLLGFIGLKMIYESTRMGPDDRTTDPLNIIVLLMLSVATSMDALAVGLSLSLLNVSIISPAVIIGVITFALSFLGVYVGDRFGHFFERKIEAAGGLVLIGIGAKILLEHLLK
jgi:putative Mn2+ efflux pump MntP